MSNELLDAKLSTIKIHYIVGLKKPDYRIHNSCVKCKLVYLKDIFVCDACHCNLRKKPSGSGNRKRFQEQFVRY